LELVKIILLTIPYLLVASSTNLEQRALELLDKTDVIASTPHALEAVVDPYPAAGDDKASDTQSVLALLQKQLQAEASRGWAFACIPRLHVKQETKVENGDEHSEVTKHPAPNITVPSPVNPGPKALFPEAFFSLYADQEVEVS
jgi:nuclear cap-binding protein subunit 1